MRLAFFIIFSFICSLGLLYFFGLLKYIVFNYRNSSYEYGEIIVIPVSGHLEDVEFLVRKNLNMLKYEKFFRKKELIFLDRGLDYETRTVLDRLCRAYNFTICEKGEIYDVMQKKLEKI